MSVDADVAICIPTYQAEAFIERTLTCARRQTHERLRIIVSVDVCEDRTAEICQRIADEDPRIRVIIQDERYGWSLNANAVLDAADCEFFFIYFHDDIIEPTYVETLLAALSQRPDAASAHCDLVEFGLLDEIKPAHTYDGSTLHRLVDFMMTKRGTTLRSLVRRSAIGDSLRFPLIHGDNHWTAYVFHMILLAAGPAIGVHQPLYRRWQRQGSLTRSKGWEHENIQSVLLGQRDSIAHSLAVIDATLADADERATARFCLNLQQKLYLRQQQIRLGNRDAIDALLPAVVPYRGDATSLKSPVFNTDTEAWVRDAEARLQKTRTPTFDRSLGGQHREAPCAPFSTMDSHRGSHIQ